MREYIPAVCWALAAVVLAFVVCVIAFPAQPDPFPPNAHLGPKQCRCLPLEQYGE